MVFSLKSNALTSRFHWLFGGFVCLFVIHFVVFIFYLNHHQDKIQKTFQDDVIQEVLHIIQLVKNTPDKDLSSATKTVSNSDYTVTLSHSPRYSHVITLPSIFQLRSLIDKHTHDLTCSIQVTKKHWVNIKASVEQSQSIWPKLFILLAELFVAGIVLFYAWSLNRFIEPLKDFQNVARGLGITLTPTLLKEYKGPSIIQETAEAMNKMQQRIKDLINHRTLMLAAISHDLKTPITRLKLRAHLIQDEKLNSEIIQDLNEMELMISELLVFSKNENTQENHQKIELNSFIETICHEIQDMGYDVEFSRAEKRVIFSCRKLAIKRALSNIILNAVKYGKKAEVSLKQDNQQITIFVHDFGPGIDEAEFENVFTPFYRLCQSRSREVEGTGLGLAIARSAVRQHNGDITLRNHPQGGLEVEITLRSNLPQKS